MSTPSPDPTVDARHRQDIGDALTRVARGRSAAPPTAGQVVAELSLGFWRFLLTNAYRGTLWPQALVRAFPHLPGRDRDTVGREVATMNRLRNRIAHLEPVYHLDVGAEHSAESQVAHVLRQEGWTVIDVSRTNVGWDLDATRADGRKRVEVKLLETRGARFALTNNELVAAKEHGSNYEIWVVLRSEKEFEFTVLSDPASSLEFERVCRQWENQAVVPNVGWRTASFA